MVFQQIHGYSARMLSTKDGVHVEKAGEACCAELVYCNLWVARASAIVASNRTRA